MVGSSNKSAVKIVSNLVYAFGSGTSMSMHIRARASKCNTTYMHCMMKIIIVNKSNG